MNIKLSRPDIGEEEIQAVVEVMRTDQLAMGPKTKEFEDRFAEMVGTKYGIAINSGTSGLHLCVRALGIGDGDEVITSPFSFIASANCILYERAIPKIVDVEEETFGINPELIESAITEKTKSILPVHVFGQPCNMNPIVKIAKKHNFSLIEDACESPLATHHGKQVGTMSDASVFAFYPNKQMTTGEGGMILTDDEDLYKSMASMRNQGRATDMQWLTHYQLGFNYRISEMTAAIGVEQTKKLPGFITKRKLIAARYCELLSDIQEVRIPTIAPFNDPSWFVFPIRVKASIRDKVLKELNAKGIQSKAYFHPCIHLQDFYKQKFGYREGMFPVAEKLSNEMIVLPFHNHLTEEEMTYVTNQLKQIITQLK